MTPRSATSRTPIGLQGHRVTWLGRSPGALVVLERAAAFVAPDGTGAVNAATRARLESALAARNPLAAAARVGYAGEPDLAAELAELDSWQRDHP